MSEPIAPQTIEENNKCDINTSYIGGKEASSILGVHQKTLQRWEENKLIETIRTPNGKRLYNVNKFLCENKLTMDKNSGAYDEDENYKRLESEISKTTKIKICYARVSSIGQKDDLERQKYVLKKKYPNHLLIEDIGSGVNMNRRGLRRIIKMAIAGNIEELVVVHKDRLTRFGYELVEDLIKEYSGGKIIITSKVEDIEPEEELVKDVLTIMNVFVARMNGMRKYKKRDQQKKLKSKKRTVVKDN